VNDGRNLLHDLGFVNRLRQIGPNPEAAHSAISCIIRPTVGAVYDRALTKCVNQANNPLLTEEGGCASKKMPRSYRSGADGVVAHNASFRNAFPQRALRATTPPLQIKWLRTIFFMSRPPLLCEEGNIPYRNQLFRPLTDRAYSF